MNTINKKHSVSTYSLLIVAMITTLSLLPPVTVSGSEFEESEAHGHSASGFSLSQYENINVANGNLTFRVPITSIRTDGGLEYSLSAYYNSKVYGYNYDSGYDLYFRGVENFGVGWDLRPPRVRSQVSCASGDDYPCQDVLDRKHILYHWVDPSGATHRLFSVPPVSWIDGDTTVNDPWGETLDNGDTVDEDCSASDADGCGCYVEENDTEQVCYTWREPLLRVTYTRNLQDGETVTVENQSGVVYTHDHFVGEHKKVADASETEELSFQADIDGFYLRKIEKGPWDASGNPANLITLDYEDSNPSTNLELNQSWLPSWIRVGPGTEGTRRSIDFSYHPQTWQLTAIAGPAFDPSSNSTDPPTNTTGFAYDSIESTLDEGESVSHLSSVTYHPDLTGTYDLDFAFQYSGGILSNVTLPARATVEYTLGTFPKLTKHRGITLPALDFFLPQPTEGVGIPLPIPRFCDDPTGPGLHTDAVIQRTISYYDPGVMDQRKETTIFAQNISCLDYSTTIDYPYEKELGSGFFDSVLGDLPDGEHRYLWTWVQEFEGDGLPEGGGLPWEEGINARATIHRFHPVSYRQFSVDVLDAFKVGESESALIGELVLSSYGGTPPLGEKVLMSPGVFKPIRHTQTTHKNLYGAPSNGSEEFRYTYLISQSLYPQSQKRFSSASDDSNDLRNCTELSTTGSAISCQSVETTKTLDRYFHNVASTTKFANAIGDHDIHRHHETTWSDPDIDGTAPTNWNLGRVQTADTCDLPLATNPADCTDANHDFSFVWQTITEPTEMVQKLYLLQQKQHNPGGCAANDCIINHYEYDTVFGLKTREWNTGGYDQGYSAAASTPATVTAYDYGFPVKKALDDGTNELLLWLGDVDEGTGKYRWTLDGSGSGTAHLYDALGRVTGTTPITGIINTGTNPPTATVAIEMLDATTPMMGTSIKYSPPGSTSFLKQIVSDARFTYNGALAQDTLYDGTKRTTQVFNELGAPTQIIERIGTGYRIRAQFDLLRKGSATTGPCGTNLPSTDETARIRMYSEWIAGESIPALCDYIPWTATHFDGAGRAIETHMPDGSKILNAYVGDSKTIGTRNIDDGTGSAGSDYTTTTVIDPLGRTAEVIEEIQLGASPEDIRSTYEYDERDRLVNVTLYKAGGQAIGQQRVFEFSDGGFLTATSEPEINTTLGSYDALGGLLEEKVRWPADPTRYVQTTYEFDEYSRLEQKKVDDRLATLYEYGDSTVGVGHPDYNQVTSATQHNYFGASDDVVVTHDWEHEGPGGAVSARETSISENGIGIPGDFFRVSYLYDQWGNPDQVNYPTWSGWAPSCDPALSVARTFDGGWLSSIGFVLDDALPTSTGVTFHYHPNGRSSESGIYLGAVKVAYQEEIADTDGMGRPQNMGFHWESSPGAGTYDPRWEATDYAYDGSGNISGVTAKTYSNTGGLLTSQTQSFTYDGLSRLTGMFDGSTELQGFSYDRFGNLKTFGNTIIVPDDTTNQIDEINGTTIPPHLSEGHWDARGNLLKVPAVNGNGAKNLEYSGEDRLQQVEDVSTGIVWRHAYDNSGERVVYWTQNNTSAVSDVRVSIRDEAGAVLTDWRLRPDYQYFGRERDYVYGLSGLVSQINWDPTSGIPTRKFVASDHLGSTRLLVDEQGNSLVENRIEYYPFGEFKPGGSVPGSTHLFTGHERDLGTNLSELDYMHARYYSSDLGRFLSVDPLGGRIGDSQSWNRYSYVLNNPLRFTDPSGMAETTCVDGTCYYGGSLEVTADDPRSGPGGAITGFLFRALFDDFNRRSTLQEQWKIEANIVELVVPDVGIGGRGRSLLRLKSVNLPAFQKLKINWKHVLSGHAAGGSRVSSLKTLFTGMTKNQIRTAIRSAYKTAKRIHTQGDRILVRGQTSYGLKIEMWINKATNTIETAYPVSGGL